MNAFSQEYNIKIPNSSFEPTTFGLLLGALPTDLFHSAIVLFIFIVCLTKQAILLHPEKDNDLRWKFPVLGDMQKDFRNKLSLNTNFKGKSTS